MSGKSFRRAGEKRNRTMLEPKPKEEGGDGATGTSAAKATKKTGKKSPKKK